MDLFPFMRWRMEAQVEGWAGLEAPRKKYIEAVYREIAERGPIAAGDISIAGKSTGPWWGWSDGRLAAEFLFRQGRVAIAGRRNFERLYDLTERVIPAAALDTPSVAPRDAKKELIVRAARAMGVGTAKDIARYYHVDGWWDRSAAGGRRPVTRTQPLFDELEEDGRLRRANVEGWKRSAYVVPGATIPKTSRRARNRVAVRSADVGTVLGTCGVRLRIPNRDLRPGTEASARLLRLAVPPGRSLRCAGRSQSGSKGVDAGRALGAPRVEPRRSGDRGRSRERITIDCRVVVTRIDHCREEGAPGEIAETRRAKRKSRPSDGPSEDGRNNVRLIRPTERWRFRHFAVEARPRDLGHRDCFPRKRR